jgi:protein-disulfide isomerase
MTEAAAGGSGRTEEETDMLRRILGKFPRPAGFAAGMLAAALAVPLVWTAPARAQEQSLPGGFSSEQVDGLHEIIRQYLVENPEVLVEALTEYQKRQRQAEQQRQQQAVIAHREALHDDPITPVLGNPDGDVTMVEFFDYRCQYCRRVAEDVAKVVKSDGRVRLVMKEFPILGMSSIRAAQAAMASVKQGKYEEYHMALMKAPGDMSDPHLMEVAKEVGLDVEKLKTDMESDEISNAIRANHAVAAALGINGTPAFVIGDTLVPGVVDPDAMRRLIAEARAKAS